MKSEGVRAESNIQMNGDLNDHPLVARGCRNKERGIPVNDNDIYIGGDFILGAVGQNENIENSERISKTLATFAKIIEGVENLVGAVKEFIALREKANQKPIPETKTPDPKVEEKPIETTPPQNEKKGTIHNAAPAGGFLWKPISEKDGNVVVLLPKRLKGKIKGVQILESRKGNILDTGKFTGIGNEDRSHYRFSKPGAKYPDGAVVQITLENGKIYNQKIKETSDRFQR